MRQQPRQRQRSNVSLRSPSQNSRRQTTVPELSRLGTSCSQLDWRLRGRKLEIGIRLRRDSLRRGNPEKGRQPWENKFQKGQPKKDRFENGTALGKDSLRFALALARQCSCPFVALVPTIGRNLGLVVWRKPIQSVSDLKTTATQISLSSAALKAQKQEPISSTKTGGNVALPDCSCVLLTIATQAAEQDVGRP